MKISQLTRRDIIDSMVAEKVNWCGRLEESEFLSRLFDLQSLPSTDGRFKDAAGDIFHTYSTYGRGVEVMMGTYNMLDLTPKGRDEEQLKFTMEWVCHHDRYEPVAKAEPAAGSCCTAQT